MAYILPIFDSVPPEVAGQDVFEIATAKKKFDAIFTAQSLSTIDKIIAQKQEAVLRYLIYYNKYFEEQENELFAILGQGKTARALADSILDRIEILAKPSENEDNGSPNLAWLIVKAIKELQSTKKSLDDKALEKLRMAESSRLKQLMGRLEQDGKGSGQLAEAINKFFYSNKSAKEEAGFLLEALLAAGTDFLSEKDVENFLGKGGRVARVATSTQSAAIFGENALMAATDDVLAATLVGGDGKEIIVKIPISLKLKTITKGRGRNKSTHWAIGNDFSGSSIQNFFSKTNAGTRLGQNVINDIEWYALNLGQARNKGWPISNTPKEYEKYIEQLSFLNGLAFIILGDQWKTAMNSHKRTLNSLKAEDPAGDSFPPLLVGSAEEMVTTAQVLRFVINFVGNGLFKDEQQRKSQFNFYLKQKWKKGAQGIIFSQGLGELEEELLHSKSIESVLRQRAEENKMSWKGIRAPEGQDDILSSLQKYVDTQAIENKTTQSTIILALLGKKANISVGRRKFVPRPHIADYMSVNYHIAISNIMALQTNK